LDTTWLRWVQQLQAISQAGLTYSRDPFDRERFEQLRHLAAEMLAARTGAPLAAVLGWLHAEAGYATPKVDVRVAVFRDNRILLVREAADQRWSVPGGWADVGESAAEVAVREVREESGYEVRVTKLLGIWDKAKHEHPPQLWYVYKIFFRAELTGGAARTGFETDDTGWFTRDAVPELSVDRITHRQIARLFEHHDSPELPADFD
jgi:ADP-ribose pyrophosphatase YjhB (NUDIX family)